MQKKGAKIIGYFFLVVFLFTLASRSVDSLLTPKVKIEKVSEQVVTHRPTSEGIVTYKKQVSMMSIPDLLIDSVEVTEGQKVEKDQILYKINVTKMNEKIKELENEISKLSLQNEQAANENAVELEKRQRSIQRATEAYNDIVNTGNLAVNRALKELETAQNDLANLDKSKENYEEERKQQAAVVAEKQKLYDETTESTNQSVNEARRAMEQESDPISTNTTASQVQKDIDEKSSELSRLEQLQEKKGEIRADISGIVTEISIKTGGLTTNEAPLLLADTDVGLRVNLPFRKEDQKYIHLGMEVLLTKILDTSAKVENQNIVSITEDEENPDILNVVVDIPKEKAEIGETLKSEINVPSKKYDSCIPIEALHIDEGNSYYVYCIEKKETVMGSETIVEKVKVELLDKNDQYAAVTGLNMDKQVITAADKEIKERTKVRVDE